MGWSTIYIYIIWQIRKMLCSLARGIVRVRIDENRER